MELERRRLEAREHQRKRQQGLGKPIISAEFKGRRFVAVGSHLRASPRWRTFQDFLLDYGRDVLGKDWWVAECSRPPSDRHPVVVWFELLQRANGPTTDESGNPISRLMTGAAAAYLRLAYDLYCLEHNALVRDRLVQRLKNQDNFPGALYEVLVAAVFTRGGFEIEFENEDDSTTSHVEFTARFKQTGRKFSVEAKRCEGQKRIGRRLYSALVKEAAHPRIVFIDLNEPHEGPAGTEMPGFMKEALKHARNYERGQGRDLPSAYVFMTNQPYPHHLDGTAFKCSFIGEGFHIPDFKWDAQFPGVRAAVEARNAHTEMDQLAKSMAEHAEIPVTFDGEAPELAFGEHPARLREGDRYLLHDDTGNAVSGTLMSATVMEKERCAYGILASDDGRRNMVTVPLSDAELAAYRRHPDTFFGTVELGGKQISNAVEAFDFVFSAYRNTPREKLLEFMATAGAPDMDRLSMLSREELARTYAERMAASMVAGIPSAKSRSGGT
ncbi:MAG: hypothetical protein WCC48_12250 [Anaeromyxobacteraceae bacterium]